MAPRARPVVVAIAGEQVDGQKPHHHDGRADGADGFQMNGRNTHEHTDDVGHEPQQPHDGAEGMEAMARLLAAAQIGESGPQRVHDHEHDGQRAGKAVDTKAGGVRLAGDVAHDEGAGGIAGKACPE